MWEVSQARRRELLETAGAVRKRSGIRATQNASEGTMPSLRNLARIVARGLNGHRDRPEPVREDGAPQVSSGQLAPSPAAPAAQ
jgi:hypothetical protein